MKWMEHKSVVIHWHAKKYLWSLHMCGNNYRIFTLMPKGQLVIFLIAYYITEILESKLNLFYKAYVVAMNSYFPISQLMQLH